MNGARKEARFAVGSRNGPRSSIWKAWCNGDDIYIQSRMHGNGIKTSLHASGCCQWSLTSEHVQEKSMANKDRHICRWEINQPTPNQAILAFKVDIPLSEILDVSPPSDTKKVFWVSDVPDGATVRFIFYISPPIEGDPMQQERLPHRPLFSLKLKSRGWLLVMVDLIEIPTVDIENARIAVLEQFYPEHKNMMNELNDHRACLFMRPNDSQSPHGLLEICLFK